MISEAFWRVQGSEIKITRSDDSSNTALLRVYTSCLSANTFRGFMFSYGKFTYRNAWSNDQCLNGCPVYYGGSYTCSSTAGFNEAHDSSNVQSSNYVGFWCQWSVGDGAVVGAVMMIGGGGSRCNQETMILM